LTNLKQRLKNQGEVSFIPDNFYAQWRIQTGLVLILREHAEAPPERLLQAVWKHQRVLRDQLKTLDGQPVRVLHPGFHNLEGGPDFRRAVLQFGNETPRQGDIEVDLQPSGWRSHGHYCNPAFGNVLLHVVWQGQHQAPGAPPLLSLRDCLDAPLPDLALWLSDESVAGFPEALRGRCCAPLRGLSKDELLRLLHQAARVRLRGKAAWFEARARQVGWTQSLWEGLFRALGYKHNVWPMQRLGELRPRWQSASSGEARSVQARLLGLSGLLPADLGNPDEPTRHYLRDVWDQWWRERDEFSDVTLPRALWRLHGIRPANHPHRRFALAAGWSMAGSLGAKLEQWCSTSASPAQLRLSLTQVLEAPPDDFWSWHWTLRSRRLARPQPLLGPTRVTDLAVNVVLPWLWIRACEGANQSLQAKLENHYFHWPAAEDNSVLRLGRERLLGASDRRVLPDAAAQQGLVQLVKDFCDHTDSICGDCKLPNLVKDFVNCN
jgi:hypothetical protein